MDGGDILRAENHYYTGLSARTNMKRYGLEFGLCSQLFNNRGTDPVNIGVAVLRGVVEVLQRLCTQLFETCAAHPGGHEEQLFAIGREVGLKVLITGVDAVFKYLGDSPDIVNSPGAISM